MKGFGVPGAVFLAFILSSSIPASAGLIYTCNSTGSDAISASVCNYLNSTIAGIYNSTFTNANADIYITYGNAGLGESVQAFNYVTYNQYLTQLTNTASGDTVDTAALAALKSFDTAVYGSNYVELTAALAAALNFTGATGVESNALNTCSISSPGCYDGVITISDSEPLYYRSLGGDSSGYDFFSVVEHETDEILGTSSCISTGSSSLVDACDAPVNRSGVPSAVDLFRYSGPGALVPDTNLNPPTTAYFSYDGGVDGANGTNPLPNAGPFYNTGANGLDYADFTASETCTYVQDAYGCAGYSKDITNDGPTGGPGPEIAILDAAGYNLAAPEPGTMALLALGFTIFGVASYRRKRMASRNT